MPVLNKTSKHTIDVVVDRLRVRPDSRQRLAESFETALAHAEGRAVVLEMDSGKQHAFSARYACPICGFAVQELEPRLFSFNNPVGACQKCDGLGTLEYFDPQRVVAHPELSLSSGAIRGWDKRNQFYFQMLQGLADAYAFDIDAAFDSLPAAVREVILFGSGTRKLPFKYLSESGRTVTKEHSFEGIVPNLERRYKETDSVVVREELAKYRSVQTCPVCEGSRLRREARYVRVGTRTLPELSAIPIGECRDYFLNTTLAGHKAQIADKVIKEIVARLQFLIDVGLDYLSLNRSADTLSGGEAQRIRLASQIGSGLTGVMYVLDEPSIGLHQRDNDRLLGTLQRLRDIGNTVIVVEHDEDAIRAADYVIDMGPGAGEHGGQIIAEGKPDEVIANETSVTGDYLSGRRKLAMPGKPVRFNPERVMRLIGASGNNLKNVTLELPVGLLTCITGVSGSGKSTLINDTLYAIAAREINGSSAEPAPYTKIEGLDFFDKIISVDQSPIGRTPRSNPATYTGMLTPIRELFAGVPEARARGYEPGRFSFNVKGGRCEACQGDGMIRVEMHFLADVFVPCDVCHGKRYNRETLEVRYKGKNIADVLDMRVEEAQRFFEAVPTVARKLDTLMEVGLGYIRLGQSATTLSGGEAQRVKLALELSKRDTGRTLFILDEPTTGLHFQDIEMLLKVLHRLREHGNTIVVIEHNLDVIKTADWIIDLGPEGGARGGQILSAGTPKQIAATKSSYTGQYLKRLLNRN